MTSSSQERAFNALLALRAANGGLKKRSNITTIVNRYNRLGYSEVITFRNLRYRAYLHRKAKLNHPELPVETVHINFDDSTKVSSVGCNDIDCHGRFENCMDNNNVDVPNSTDTANTSEAEDYEGSTCNGEVDRTVLCSGGGGRPKGTTKAAMKAKSLAVKDAITKCTK
jgi:hypothetical protein